MDKQRLKDIEIFSEDFNYEDFQAEAIKRLKSRQPLGGKDVVLMPLIKQLIEASLDGEIEAHLDEEQDAGQSNRRNRKLKKTVKTSHGQMELSTPRDRSGTFEPQLVKKRQTVLNESLDNKVLALYGLGMSYQVIA